MALERAISHWAENVLGEPEPLEAIAVEREVTNIAAALHKYPAQPVVAFTALGI
ncbi:MAG: hypothetical protein ACKVZH_18240 [Blastocatellia bacterium]